MATPANDIRSFLKLQLVILDNMWIDACMQKNLYSAEITLAWKYTCNARIERLAKRGASMEDIILECHDQMAKTEILRAKLKNMKPEPATLTSIDFLI